MKNKFIIFAAISSILLCSYYQVKANDFVINDAESKKITITTPDKKLSLIIDYAKGCVVSKLIVNGKQTLSSAGVFSGMSKGLKTFTSAKGARKAIVSQNNQVTIHGISYGDKELEITESWTFTLKGNAVIWDITREYNQDAILEDNAFPRWNFSNLSEWKGGILDNGGMVWCKYLKNTNDTYGVHTGGVTFWNADTGNGLRISPTIYEGNKIASKFSQNENGNFTFSQIVSKDDLKQRHNLSRFVNGKFDVFAPFKVKKGRVKLSLKLDYVDYFKAYSRGNLPGIDAVSVRELLNTTGRYGVVDNNIIGGNGWLTNWKCLHEPFFAQTGMALNDVNYEKNMSSTLDQERDLAMLEDGRVLSRWHNAPGDEIKGTYNLETGYYEAMWGITVDSQTGYVINTSEQFDLTGDVNWLKSHKLSVEKALDWLIKRDANNNGLFEMMNNNISEKKASDWLDIVWASYENAFVNAQMYEALNLWSNCERILGDEQKAIAYSKIADRLKVAFNKSTKDGGFWSEERKQYIYWRDNDGSIHGNNLVTPVNFAAIAFGLCDDKTRIAQVLDQIEQRSKAENLFHWPLCFDSFEKAELSERNWPFPKYENGDIFPTWGYMGIRAYAKYNKSIALKYIQNLLAQYKKDGLSSQRYSRTTQLGLGDDILAGISTSITALYRDIYGIRPKWNRMGLEPNLTPLLNGTSFPYTLRGKTYQINLKVDNYALTGKNFSVISGAAFGVNEKENLLQYFFDNQENKLLEVNTTSNSFTKMIVKKVVSAENNSKNSYSILVKGLKANAVYTLKDSSKTQVLKSDKSGTLSFKISGDATSKYVLRIGKAS
ncbi:hypothetical protein [Pedobacter sp.]|uniref:alpha-L-rhamnosidase-related protein n=1 Tax=Pedobacter sp. TaxID=1411316 RepID=UPI003BAD18F5